MDVTLYTPTPAASTDSAYEEAPVQEVSEADIAIAGL